MTIGLLRAGAKGDPTNSTGKDVADTVNYLYQNTFKTNPVIWLGIDSFTEGSGSPTKSYNTVLEKLARGVVGWGGRWIPFSNATAWGEFSIYKQGINDISELPYSNPRRVKSLDGKGFYTTAGADCVFLIEPTFNWSYADVYYLQTPNGGSFNIDRPTGQSTITVNTNGVESIKKVRVNKDLRNGTTSNNNSVRVQSNPVGAEFTVYGVVFYSGDEGAVYINVAQGGRKTADQVLFDAEFQQQWFNLLGVDTAVINAGMNDRSVSSPETFQSDLTTVISRFPAGTKIIIQRPNDPTDSQLTQYNGVYTAVAAQFGATYIDTLALFGDFTTFTARGWMADGVHPNEHYQIRQAQEVCKTLFGRCRYENTPPVINYSGGDPQ